MNQRGKTKDWRDREDTKESVINQSINDQIKMLLYILIKSCMKDSLASGILILNNGREGTNEIL